MNKSRMGKKDLKACLFREERRRLNLRSFWMIFASCRRQDCRSRNLNLLRTLKPPTTVGWGAKTETPRT